MYFERVSNIVLLFICCVCVDGHNRQDEHGATVELRRRKPVLHVHAQWSNASALHACSRWRGEAADIFSGERVVVVSVLVLIRQHTMPASRSRKTRVVQGGVHGYKLFQRQGTPMLAVVLEVYADKTPEETKNIDDEVRI